MNFSFIHNFTLYYSFIFLILNFLYMYILYIYFVCFYNKFIYCTFCVENLFASRNFHAFCAFVKNVEIFLVLLLHFIFTILCCFYLKEVKCKNPNILIDIKCLAIVSWIYIVHSQYVLIYLINAKFVMIDRAIWLKHTYKVKFPLFFLICCCLVDANQSKNLPTCCIRCPICVSHFSYMSRFYIV